MAWAVRHVSARAPKAGLACAGGGVISAHGFGAAVESSAGFEARGSALMASSSGLSRCGRPWRGLCDARTPESVEMPLACIGWASAIVHSRPSIKDTKQPTMNHRSTIDGGVSGAEKSVRKGFGGASNSLIVG